MASKGWTSNVKINSNEISSEAPPSPDDGVYRFEVDKASAEPTKKGEGSITLELSLTSHFKDGEAALQGKSKKVRFQRLYLTEESLWKLKQFCQSVGLAMPDDTSYGTITEFVENLPGAAGIAKVRNKAAKDGKSYPEVAQYVTDDEATKIVNGEATDGGSGDEAAADGEAAPRRRRRAA